MIDIHSHILPGIDDGSPNLETSLEMAEIAVEDGVSAVIATPHLKKDFSEDYISSCVDSFQKSLDYNEIKLKVFTGAEIPFNMLRDEINPVTLAGSNFILAEFMPDHIPEDSGEVFKKLLHLGYKIIIAHPERNIVFLKKNRYLKKLLFQGVFIQVTAMSLKGSFGYDILKFSEYLLKNNLIDFIATDSHDSFFRIPKLSFLFESKKNKKLKEKIEIILKHNPKKIIREKS
jgi:protein-tyrosine phosphatase